MTAPDTPARVELAKAREILLAPRRDWRFWAATAVALALFTITVAFTQILSDRNNWRDRFERQSTEQLCRSAASAEVQKAQADVSAEIALSLTVIDRGLAAVATGNEELLILQAADLERRAAAVEASTLALDLAVEAQQVAIRTCQPASPPTIPALTATTEEP